MAEASSGQEFQNHKNSSIVKDRENDAMELSATASSADLYRMCKKIAQLTKVRHFCHCLIVIAASRYVMPALKNLYSWPGICLGVGTRPHEPAGMITFWPFIQYLW